MDASSYENASGDFLGASSYENAYGDFLNATTCECEACEPDPRLIVSVVEMLEIAFYFSLFLIALAGVHFLLKLLRDCAQRPDAKPYSWFVGVPEEIVHDPSSKEAGTSPAAVRDEHGRAFEFQMGLRRSVQKHFDPKDSRDNRLDFFMTAKCEGQSFTNFCGARPPYARPAPT